MNYGKNLFAQVMECVPWKTFGRIIEKHGGDVGVRTLGCAEFFRIMAFARYPGLPGSQPIQAFSHRPARSTLADALNARDWPIYHALAMNLIPRARSLYAQDVLASLDLDVTVYALDATTIDLCLSLFDWAPFRSTKAAIKLHTELYLRGKLSLIESATLDGHDA